MKLFLFTATAAAGELMLRIELPKDVQDQLWGLALLVIGVLAVWLKGEIGRINAKHDLELDAIRSNQEQSKSEREWLLETTKQQVNQIGALQKANEQLQEQNRQRDMEIGAQREAVARITKERDELKERADARHDAINKAQAETAAALAEKLKETNRADAAEGDLAEVRKELETIRLDLANANEAIKGLQAQLDAQALVQSAPAPAEPAAGSIPTTPAGGTVA